MRFSAFPLTHTPQSRPRALNGAIPFSADDDLSLSKCFIRRGVSRGGKTENGFSASKPTASNRCEIHHFPHPSRKNSERLRLPGVKELA